LYKHYIITFGGIESSHGAFVKHISILNLKTHETKQIKLKQDDQKASQRWGHTACLLEENQIVIFGGQSSQNILNDVAVIEIKHDPEDSCNSLMKNLILMVDSNFVRMENFANKRSGKFV